MRHIGVVTTARSDFGMLLPVIREVERDPGLGLTLFVSGRHLSVEDGNSIEEVHGAAIRGRVEIVSAPTDTGSGESVASAMGQATENFGAALGRLRPDIVVVTGDRFDMLPAVLAALPQNIPVAHISGGELTQGVIDDAIRHVVTKLSHLHFACHERYARRIVQLGEEPWRVSVTGEPGLDELTGMEFVAREQMCSDLGIPASGRISVLTYHPETLRPGESGRQVASVLAAAAGIETALVITYPNGDPGSAAIAEAIEAFVRVSANAVRHKSLGRARYLQLLRHADCVVGNSSSGIIETASFALPTVNIGDRQQGRIAPYNVISVPCETHAIAAAWRKALDPAFRQPLTAMSNPYGDGHAARRIAGALKSVAIDSRLLTKRFFDLDDADASAASVPGAGTTRAPAC